MQALGADVLALAKDGPGLVHRLLSDLADDRLLFHVRTSQSREDGIAANRRARLVSASVLSVALSILLVGSQELPFGRALPFAPIFAVMLAAVLVYVALLWRQLR
jgi:hypothetical protein